MTTITNALIVPLVVLGTALPAFPQAPTVSPDSPKVVAFVADARKIAGREWAAAATYFCTPGQQPNSPTAPVVAPTRVFDNLYFIGTRIHTAWALTTSAGIIVIDTLFDYAIETEMIEGMTTLGLNPRDIKYVLISHAHGDHDQGAALLQSRHGAKIVMGAADWDATLQRAASAPGGVPKRDIAVGRDGLKLTLGDTIVDVIATPGHTPGTLSYFFPVKDTGRTLIVAYSGGTAFNFPRQAANFAIYRDSQRKMTEVAEAAGATVPCPITPSSTVPTTAPGSPSSRARRGRRTRTRPIPPR